MALALTLEARAQGRVRWGILLMLFVTTVVNYADRAIISIAGTPMSQELGLSPVTLGYILSALSWSYVAAQVPGGWLLDRYGSKWVYAGGIFFWSLFTLLEGWVGFLGGGAAASWAASSRTRS